jgi:hypothetical protein
MFDVETEVQTDPKDRVKYLLALRAVMILHEDYHYENGYLKTTSGCVHCKTDWPCATMQVIQKELSNV